MRGFPSLVVALLLVTVGCAATGPEGPAATATGVDDVDGPAWRATVIEVVDGDTIDVRYGNGSTDTVRLLGVDAPEDHVENDPSEFEGVADSVDGHEWLSSWAEEASAFLADRLTGETVLVQTDVSADRRGSYGRLLAYVVHDGTDVNELLLERGLARLYDAEFERHDSYRSTETDAMKRGVGIWGDST